MTDSVLEKINQVLKQRKNASADSSYVATLYEKGLDAILKKIGEEATETILAAKSGDKHDIIHETADLWFHCLVMLVDQGIEPEQILNELDSRFGISGHDEKANRQQ